MKIGIVGGGIVGRAIARAYLEHVEEVRVYDIVKERRTHDLAEVMLCDLIFVCLPESTLDSFFGRTEPGFVVDRQQANLVLKSTCPIGTTRRLRDQYGLSNLVHSPEFLTVRCAMTDVQCPAVNIIGHPFGHQPINHREESEYQCFEALNILYHTRFPGTQVLMMRSDESEAVKLFLNSFFAVKVAFFNEIRTLADNLGLDWETVRAGMLADGRIAHAHTQVPGPDGHYGFGGQCLPKDLINLCATFGNEEVPNPVIHAAQYWIRRLS